jgi:hypothetical protein
VAAKVVVGAGLDEVVETVMVVVAAAVVGMVVWETAAKGKV